MIIKKVSGIKLIFKMIMVIIISDCIKYVIKMSRYFSHIRPLGAAGALAVDICICFHDIES